MISQDTTENAFYVLTMGEASVRVGAQRLRVVEGMRYRVDAQADATE